MTCGQRSANLKGSELAAKSYNKTPVPLTIAGVRSEHSALFDSLGRIPGHTRRALHFHGHMREKYGQAYKLPGKAAYLKYILGWMLDSSSKEGAALKGWAHSRFGLDVTWHKESLTGKEKARARYDTELKEALAADGTAFDQFDLLYEYAQYELNRQSQSHILLYRGTGHLTGDETASWKPASTITVKLNSLNSFTRNFERAWEFGDRVIEISVPVTKIFFDDEVMHTGILTGEEEVIVLGGKFDACLRW